MASVSYVNNYFRVDDPKTNLDKLTENGGVFDDRMDFKIIENHHYVWYYVCWEELKTGWNDLSEYDFEGQDKKGQPMYGTLIRYMASKGLRKDLEGLQALSDEDLRKVENGQTSIVSG